MEAAPHPAALRVGMVQFKPAKARVEENLERVSRRVGEAAGDHDLLVFPETSLSGYFLEGGVLEAAVPVEWLAEGLGAPPAAAPDVVVGFYEHHRGRLYNSVAYLSPDGASWRVVHVHRKMFLPTYGIFDEGRFLETGRELRAFDTRFGRVGMLVCEEMWHSLPATVLALAGAELLVVVSASPARDFTPRDGRPGNLERWERLAPSTAVEHGIFVVVSQLVGSEGGKLFPGGSLAVGPDGAVVARGPLMQEGVTSVAFDGERIRRARFEAPLLADLERMLPHLDEALDEAVGNRGGKAPDGADPAPPHLQGTPTVGAGTETRVDPGSPARREGLLDLDLELVERTLVEFLHEEIVAHRGFEKVVVGVSGGVDSAVSTFLAVRALGAENVHGFRLPYRTSSPESLEHADRVLEAAGARRHTIDITGPVDSYVEEHEPELSDRRRGNLMARVRAVLLFDQSAKLDALPLGTGNKSERLLGYYTWHADDSPPINPLGDLFKTQVWALARHLGVPPEIVEKPATADLVQGVTDEDDLGIGYEEADVILYWLVRGYRAPELVRHGFDEHAVELVARRLNTTHWKRELPTVAVVSSSAIGEFYLRPVDY